MKELIKKRRKELGITLEEVGEYVGVSKTTVQRWESGNISNMRRDRIAKLSEILKLDVQQLLGFEGVEGGNFAKIPLLGRVAAGVPVTAQEDIKGYENIPAAWAQTDTYFALEIKGDSMEPRIAQGDTVIVKSQPTVENGETAIVLVGDEATCKKVIKNADNLVLVSNNPKYEPMFFTPQDIEQKPVVILGRVVQLRAKL